MLQGSVGKVLDTSLSELNTFEKNNFLHRALPHHLHEVIHRSQQLVRSLWMMPWISNFSFLFDMGSEVLISPWSDRYRCLSMAVVTYPLSGHFGSRPVAV